MTLEEPQNIYPENRRLCMDIVLAVIYAGIVTRKERILIAGRLDR
jgi:hypothetical protein